MYPTEAGFPKLYGLPEIHKTGVPLEPIVSNRETVTYEITKELARTIRPVVGKSAHHVQNTRDFVQEIRDIKLKKDECVSHIC